MGFVFDRNAVVWGVGVRGGCVRGLILSWLLLVLCSFVLHVASVTLGAFTRASIGQVTTTPDGKFGPEGVTTDSLDNLWVGDGSSTPNRFDEFEPATGGNGFLTSVPVESFTFPHSLAIERLSGDFIITGSNKANDIVRDVEVVHNEGKLAEMWKHQFADPSFLTIDHSSNPAEDPSACSSTCVVYVTAGGAEHAIEKFNAKGEAVPFSGSAPYIKGSDHNEIMGTAVGNFDNLESPGAVTVDSEGDIYAAVTSLDSVDEYRSSGEFVQEFDVPGVGEDTAKGGFVGTLEGVAVDPVSKHLLVSVSGGAVDEFDIDTGRFLSQIADSEVEVSAGVRESRHLDSADALTTDSLGDLYVVDDDARVIDVYGPGHYLPTLALGSAIERKPASAVLVGSVNPESLINPEKAGISDCHFEYVTDEAFKRNLEMHNGEGFADLSSGGEVSCVPGSAEIPKDSSVHAVRASISGLMSGTTYRYRLVARTEGALGGTSVTSPLAFTAPHAARVDSTSAGNLSSSFADLRAVIDPLGATTTYFFQYVTESDFNASGYADARITPVVNIGSGGPTGSSEEGVLQHVGGLTASTTYRFRVVAESDIEGKVAMIDGPDDLFTTLPKVAIGLPDNRAYELVTPANKHGGSDMFALPFTNGEFSNKDVGFPSLSGNEFLLSTAAAFGPFPASAHNFYVFYRGAGEWDNVSLASPSLGVQSVSDVIVDPANLLSGVGTDDLVGSSASEGGARNTSLVGHPGGPYTQLHEDPPVHTGEHLVTQTTIVGASHTLDRLVLESYDHSLCPGAEMQDADSDLLCEWSAGGECGPEASNCHLVNLNPEGALFRCGAVLGSGGPDGAAHNAVSYDGSKIFFTAPDPKPKAKSSGPGCWNGGIGNPPELYMRTGGKTIVVSISQEEVFDPTGQHPAEYVGASEDGSKVFFITETWLTADHPEAHDRELYMYETDTSTLKRISVGETSSLADLGAGAGAEVNTVPVVSADGAAVYFTAFAALAPGAQQLKSLEGPEVPVNVYRYDTASATTSYVATVNTIDYDLGSGKCGGFVPAEVALCADANWYTTPDGRYLLFASSRALTSYNTAGPCPTLPNSGAIGNGHCDELYRYDSVGGEIVCVSCNPSGAGPTSNAEFARSAPTEPSSGPVRAMSDNGSFVFFDTADGLVPTDENKTLDVYEWRSGGTNSCTVPDGCVSLISSGQDPGPSFFLGASPDGNDVFFGTHAKLVSQDTDTNGDVYDARICEPEDANPCIGRPPGETALCEGDACQNPPLAPIDATPTSLTFVGPPNPKPAVSPPKSRSLTRAQRLARALRACEHKRKQMRPACKARARKVYSAKPGPKKAKGSLHTGPQAMGRTQK